MSSPCASTQARANCAGVHCLRCASVPIRQNRMCLERLPIPVREGAPEGAQVIVSRRFPSGLQFGFPMRTHSNSRIPGVGRSFLSMCLPVVCIMSLVATAAGDDWPQWRGPNRDGVWHETGIMEKFPQPQIHLLWRTPISNGYSGPSVANGRVYVTDRQEQPAGMERVLCLDARTGRILWIKEYACAYTGLGYGCSMNAANSSSPGSRPKESKSSAAPNSSSPQKASWECGKAYAGRTPPLQENVSSPATTTRSSAPAWPRNPKRTPKGTRRFPRTRGKHTEGCGEN